MGNYIILGAGRIGKAIAYDVLKNDKESNVYLVDQNKKNLDETLYLIDSIDHSLKYRMGNFNFDIMDGPIERLMRFTNIIIGAASYKYNYELTKKALKYNSNFIDLGGNNTVVEKQFTLNNIAKKNGITVIPDCGVTPGLVSILVADAMNELGEADEVKIRVGGLPKDIPPNPLKYIITFSPTGLINEYIEPCPIIKDGKFKKVPGMSGLEDISFKGFPELEAFNTSGGTSTLPKTYAGRIKNLDCKTIRYKGHCDKIKKLFNVFEVKPNDYGYRQELEDMLLKLCSYDSDDMILMRVTAKNKNKTISYEMIDYQDNKGITAMMRTTGFPASIIAQMLVNREITKPGVIEQELIVPPDRMIKELRKRGVFIEKKYN